MTRIQKTLEERLAEARARRQKADALLQALETKQKQRDVRTRAKGEKALIKAILAAAGADAVGRLSPWLHPAREPSGSRHSQQGGR